LLLEYKYHQRHGAYILTHADLAGFSYTDRQLLVMLVTLYKGDIEHSLLIEQSAIDTEHATKLLIILRLAIILCRRRSDDILPDYQVDVVQQTLRLSLPKSWLAQHPLITDELSQEGRHLESLGFSLEIKD
jgi:exopolyphosphatase/guanosine-5'-triphosphate,3'-diphosphate pyrophosphatase